MVERFDPKPRDNTTVVLRNPHGNYVRHSDYARLQEQLRLVTAEREFWKVADRNSIDRAEAAEARAARLAVLLRKIRWYVEAYDTREHNRDQDKDLTEIDAALDVKEAR